MFLNPFLLFGIAGISVPIVIHLLNQRKFQRVRWAAMRFVQASVEKNRRRMRIEDLLLLLVRCAIVALLAIALARPAMSAAAGLFGRAPATAVILLDNSFSMGKSDGVETRFETAKKAADAVIADLPRGSSAAVYLFSDVARDVIPQPTADLNLARQKVREATLSDRGTNVFAGVERAYKVLQNASGAEKELFLVTDNQAAGWHRGTSKGGENSDVLRLMEEHKDKISTRVLLMPDADTRNLAVSDLRLMTELPTVNKVLRFEVEVTNHGPAEVRDVPVKLFVDDGASPVEEATIDAIPAGGAKSISLHARLRTDGYRAITAKIPQDALPADDARSTVVHVLRQVQVLLVDGEAGRDGREEDEFFVREALQPVPVDQRPAYFIQTRTVAAADLATTSLDSYDAVVLANVASLTKPTVDAFERLISDGRGLIVFTGPNVNAGFYNDTLYRQRGILPAALGEAVGDATQGEKFVTLQSGHFEHPITRLWNEEGRGSLSVAHFFRMFELKTDAGAATRPDNDIAVGAPAVVANYADGKPAIVEHTFGQGRVVLFGSTANTQWNDFPVRASVFIPMMHRVLDSILQRQGERLTVQVGQKFVMRAAGESLGKEASVTPPARSGITLADAVPIEIAPPPARYPQIAYDRTEWGGVYKVSVEGAAQELVQFAAQPDSAESDLTPLSEQDVESIKNAATVVSWKPGTAMQAAVVNVGAELWRPLAMAVLLLAGAETLLAFWFSRVK